MDNKKGGFGGNRNSRDNKKGGFGGNRDGNRDGGFRDNRGPKEMHKATCADCKNECEVPFKPSEDRPVYCRDCFQKHKNF